jgi:hypothetical protein
VLLLFNATPQSQLFFNLVFRFNTVNLKLQLSGVQAINFKAITIFYKKIKLCF